MGRAELRLLRHSCNKAVEISQRYLYNIKTSIDKDVVGKHLRHLISLTSNKSRFVVDLYSNSHPGSIGKLTRTELDCIIDFESEFTNAQWFCLMGVFAIVDWETVRPTFRKHIDIGGGSRSEISEYLFVFIQYLHVAALRYRLKSQEQPIAWAIEMIAEHSLDGSILESYPLAFLRDESEFKISLSQFVKLIRSRIELEKLPRSNDFFEIMPHNFNVGEWCEFDEQKIEDVEAFEELCRLALTPSFIAFYSLPRYIAQLDESGKHVTTFVEKYLDEVTSVESKNLSQLANLASGYSDSQHAWATIATPICKKASQLKRQDRGHIYFGLSRKDVVATISSPGKVADHYIQARENAEQLLQVEPVDSPLREYREWVLQSAENELQRERESAEEDSDD